MTEFALMNLISLLALSLMYILPILAFNNVKKLKGWQKYPYLLEYFRNNCNKFVIKLKTFVNYNYEVKDNEQYFKE